MRKHRLKSCAFLCIINSNELLIGGDDLVRVWSDEEIEILTRIYPIKTIEELVELFPNKTDKQINKKAKQLKLKKDKLILKEYRLKKSLAARNDLWSNEELETLQQYYPLGGTYEASKYLPHKSNDGIRRKANTLGLIIQEDFSQWDLIEMTHSNISPFVYKYTFKKKVIK